jgi:sporulation protein YlmC with PRC-barrel domain
MSSPEEVDLGLGILDHQLVDSEGRRCGKVDDLELGGVGSDEQPRVVAILVGPPVWTGRGMLGRVAAALSRGRMVRVPWDEVEKVDSAIRLRKTAKDLRLARADDRLRPLIERLPGS